MKHLTILLLTLLISGSLWADDERFNSDDIQVCDDKNSKLYIFRNYEFRQQMESIRAKQLLNSMESWNFCSYEWADGIYTGEWNHESNLGIFIFTNGTIYAGEFDSDYQLHGEGIMTLPDGEKHEGTWVVNELNGENIHKIYQRRINPNTITSQCNFICGDGSMYWGSCKDSHIFVNNNQCKRANEIITTNPQNSTQSKSIKLSDWMELYTSISGLAAIKNELDTKKRERKKRQDEVDRAYRKGLKAGKKNKLKSKCFPSRDC